MKKILAALLLAPVCTLGHAGDRDPGWLVGVGQHSCGKFMQAMRAHPPNGRGINENGVTFVSESETYEQWIWGYLSAASFRFNLPPTGDGPGYTEWVSHWCESHADEPVASAVGALVAHLVQKTKKAAQ